MISLNILTIIGARLAQSVEHETLNLRVVGSSPTLGGEIFFSFSPEKSLNHSKSGDQECLEKRRKNSLGFLKCLKSRRSLGGQFPVFRFYSEYETISAQSTCDLLAIFSLFQILKLSMKYITTQKHAKYESVS